MNCSKCGSEILEGNNFCAKCGQATNAQFFQYQNVSYQKEDILKIAKFQTMIIFGILFLIILTPLTYIPGIVSILATLLYLVNVIYYMTAFCLLRTAQKGNIAVTILLAILLLLPLISLITLLFVNGKATNILQSAGLKVGLMGVTKPDLDEFKNK